MKAQILKHTGLTEKQFYAKYKTPEDFDNSKEGKSFKKAQTGAAIQKAQNYGNLAKSLKDPYNINGLNNPRFGQTANYADTRGYGYNNPGYGNNNVYGSNMPAQTISLTDEQVANEGGKYDGYSDPQNAPKKGPGFDGLGAMNFIGGIKDAFDGIKAAEAQTMSMNTWADVSDVQKKAEISNAFVPKQPNQWYSPDDPMNVQSANEMYNPVGRGTDVFNVQNGSMIGGNPTQTSNNYGPDYTLYDDLEYDNDDDRNIKAYQGGGGFGNMLGGGNSKPFLGGKAFGKEGLFGGDTSGGNWLAGAMGGNSSWANAASIIPGPVGMFATMAGQMFDPNPGKQKNAENTMNSNQAFGNRIKMGAYARSPFTANTQNGGDIVEYEEGGYMNPEYNPQVITMFGDHTAEDFADYANKYRAGGHLKEYTPPSERAMQTYENGGEMNSYAMGGKIQSYGQGKVVDESYNPYMPGSGISSMIKGPSHKNGGVGISYGNAQNGTNEGAQIEAEGGESMMEMANGGQMDPQTGEQETNAVVIGNIPAEYKVLSQISDNEDFLNYIKKKGNDGRTMKTLFKQLTKEEIAATKLKEKASKIANNADESKWGKLDMGVAKILEDAGDTSLEKIANTKMGFAESQDRLHKIKGKISKGLGYNISAEDLGRGKIKKDFDEVTRYAPLDDVAKSGGYLRKAQNSTTIPSGGSGTAGDISQDEYDQFLKEYEDSKASGKKKSQESLKFQRHYHKFFPDEALAAIQKTTAAKGLSNKAKQLGLTVADIASGKDVDKILQSNEDEYFGPRTEQYMASVKSKFKKTPPAAPFQPATLGTPPAPAATSDKKEIDVVPLKNNNSLQAMDMMGRLFQNNGFPPMDPRQNAGEYVASSLNALQPVPMQKPSVELDPIYRMNYNDVRADNTAAFRDMLRQNQGNPAADALAFARFAQQNQSIGGEEFRTNQGIEQSIYGGNRAKVNQNQATALALNADQANKQSIAKSKTDQTNIEIAKSMADKAMKYTADKNKYMVDRNLFPNYRYDQGYGMRMQGPGYNPTIPQIYGGKGTIQQVPVYKDGELDHYEMIEGDKKSKIPSLSTGPITTPTRNGGSVVKNAKNGSVVRAYKNL